ncbi:TMV resistance protein N [Vitis vinifera]|uniref:ADP-ribosyl cyclase/cyclic ADP-ribose hydrolase n=1 Tax=Vitis vinifera TaxID=29760 RepID=A0A438FVT9_VITVI|nr:TMV resistance protein N [Vitis vinifera]
MDSQISTTASSSSSISPTSISKDEYDVFLSFSWEDIGTSFADRLYAALVRKGLRPFREAIGKPESKEAIASESLMAIQKSKVFIVIFSENYARSRYNLDQLVKIVEEYRRAFLTRPASFKEDVRATSWSSISFRWTQEVIVPVYYHVCQSDVREQKGSYGEAFYNHKAKQEKEKIEKWGKALTEAGCLSGYALGQKQ